MKKMDPNTVSCYSNPMAIIINTFILMNPQKDSFKFMIDIIKTDKLVTFIFVFMGVSALIS